MNFGAVWQNMLRVGMPKWLRDSNGLIIGLRSPDGNWTAGNGNSNFDGAYASLSGKPTLFDGAYASLTGLPTLFNGAYGSLTGLPTLFPGTFAALTSKPTTLSGYGITDAATSAALTSGLAGKFATPAGTTAQYVRGDGSLATLPSTAGQVNSDWSATSGVAQILNKPTTLAGFGITDAVTGAALTSALSGYATTAALNAVTPVAPAYSYPTPALNTAFQASATRDAQVAFPVDVTISSLLTSVEGLVFLEYADNAAMSTNLVNVMSAGQLLGGVINITNRGTVTLNGRIPAGKYVRLRTQNVAGTPTYAARQGQQVLL